MCKRAAGGNLKRRSDFHRRHKKAPNQFWLSARFCFGRSERIRPLRHPHHAGSCVGSPPFAVADILSAFLTLSQRSLRFESSLRVDIKKAPTLRQMLIFILVGARGFEPPTSWSQTKRATRLRYAPTDGIGNMVKIKLQSLFLNWGCFFLYKCLPWVKIPDGLVCAGF